MAIDRAAVDHVARLARLDLSEQERDRMSEELARILEHAELIQALDLHGVEPTSHPLPLVNALRPDEAGRSLGPEEALGGAPQAEGGCFRVPRIIEEP
ncbi:MAG: Asp-tRNA(Asn)/Glu-tRNA(Gln) amidotransferase subunit GatC [Actinomycetota bacterium]|nr:Asp-tRNA(Asn)/Glu-tRNA(Gln) amidotransferase subunit GatC [Actinomycetota bacterium]